VDGGTKQVSVVAFFSARPRADTLDLDDHVEQGVIANEDATTPDKSKETAGAHGVAQIGRPMTGSQGPFIEAPSAGIEVEVIHSNPGATEESKALDLAA